MYFLVHVIEKPGEVWLQEQLDSGFRPSGQHTYVSSASSRCWLYLQPSSPYRIEMTRALILLLPEEGSVSFFPQSLYKGLISSDWVMC